MKQKRFSHRSGPAVVSLILAVGVVVADARNAGAGAGTGEPEWDQHPGYVDGSEFAALADDKDTLIEITIRGPLLKVVSKALSKDDEQVGSFLDQIVSINAVIVGVKDHPERAAQLISTTNERMEKRGWQRLARIREDDSDTTVYMLNDDEAIDGITVIVSEDDEVVFANVAGRINLELIGDLGSRLNIPGLKELTGGDWQQELEKSKTRRGR